MILSCLSRFKVQNVIVIIIVLIIAAIVGTIYFSNTSNAKEVKVEEPVPPYAFQEGVITFVPYDESIDEMTAEEQVEVVAKNTGAGIIVLTNYEQKEENLIENFQEEIYQLIKRDDVVKMDIDGHNRYILQGSMIDYLFE